MTSRSRSASTALAGLTAAALVLAACGNGERAAPGDEVKVVVSTSVWGSVVQAVAGDAVEVESIIDDPSADPHSYESTPRDAAEVTDADLVVFNGGGYDEFIEQILGSGGGKPTVSAVESEHEGEHAGHDHDHAQNEHVWYDLHVVQEVADRVAAELGRLRPAQAEQFRQAAERFRGEVGALQTQVDEIAAAHRDRPVIVTEPIAHYLVEAAGLRDITPPSFVNAVEAETDPSAAAVAELQNALGSGQAAAVIHNPQTESPVTRTVRSTAEQQGIPVVEMTETPPPGATYVQWMGGQIAALRNALDQER
ncbi:metal ABC transporter solute-binding protein, Zn/Mn family [Saccharopolyspora hordei]|uniref:Zinc/manganese transport system substrate-binding protein n=1 Tax=Saccharopolyspora hordei TaxID=1838 RepID=A0A853ANA0_9PSEU|nr:zinc ABC transporter substrate-binding protein [Saccharopolyspora hordei]NYI81660.1 zinc/manganese transport system substrate-binding protein [Saccharopolyspora hordei]